MKAHNFKNRLGEEFVTNQGYKVKILEYNNAQDCTIQFEDNLILFNKTIGELNRGSIRNPNHRSVFGVGFLGVGIYTPSIHGKLTLCYSRWRGMLGRCYNLKIQNKSQTYIGCLVDERWHNFQVFAQWWHDNYNPETMEGWCLDKDILCKSCKVYSPETCSFLPYPINNLLTQKITLCTGSSKKGSRYSAHIKIGSEQFHLGMYNSEEECFEIFRKNKNAQIKKVANEWRGKITEQVYEILMQYDILCQINI